MNCDTILRQAIKHAAEAYKAGAIDVETMKARSARISGLRRLSGELERRKERIRKSVAKHHRAMTRVRTALASHEVFVAIDVGYTDACPIEEVGITTYAHGAMSTVNYIVEGQEAFRSGIPCIYGETRVLPLAAILERVQAAYDGAVINVFHAAHIDIAALGLDVSRRYYVDTAGLAHFWDAENASLDALCTRYGVSNDGAHNSGNDSRRTLEVLLAQSEDKTPPYFRLIAPEFAGA